jgi:hypothetical protein
VGVGLGPSVHASGGDAQCSSSQMEKKRELSAGFGTSIKLFAVVEPNKRESVLLYVALLEAAAAPPFRKLNAYVFSYPLFGETGLPAGFPSFKKKIKSNDGLMVEAGETDNLSTKKKKKNSKLHIIIC